MSTEQTTNQVAFESLSSYLFYKNGTKISSNHKDMKIQKQLHKDFDPIDLYLLLTCMQTNKLGG